MKNLLKTLKEKSQDRRTAKKILEMTIDKLDKIGRAHV